MSCQNIDAAVSAADVQAVKDAFTVNQAKASFSR
jgi:hypothetical protein